MKTTNHKARLFGIGCFFLILWGLLLWRMVDLTVLNRSFLQEQGNARSLRMLEIPAYRGMIIDRQGAALAVSTPVQSIWINPKLFHPTKEQAKKLEKILGIKANILMHKSEVYKNREFVYIKRQMMPSVANKIMDLHIIGINIQEEFKRYYPEADHMSQLIGFTNVDDHGIEGLELAYQNWLAGYKGKKQVIKDRLGQVIETLRTIKEPQPGQVLQLSLDRRIQYIAYNALQKTLTNFHAKFGSVVVLDAETGEVLAIANAPSFNPNLRSNYTLNFYRNKALTDAFEPGSVMKPFSVASALDAGGFTPKTIINTKSSPIIIHGHVIRDVHDYGVLDVTGVLRYSSNIGVTKMVLAHPPEQLHNLLKSVGIGQRTESGYPGESEGALVNIKAVNPFVLATLSFGYGMSVTALQVAKGYTIFANQGRLLPISLLYSPNKKLGEQVITEKTANQVLTMLEEVVNDGTGKSAKVPGYRVAGKTGTARVAGKKGYGEKRYISSFVGIAPVSKPKLIVAVFIHEPSGHGYYGAAVAAPLFSTVMESSLRLLDIPPDQL